MRSPAGNEYSNRISTSGHSRFQVVRPSSSSGRHAVPSCWWPDTGPGRLSGLVLGSVSQHCIAQAHCPVVVVRAIDGEDD